MELLDLAYEQPARQKHRTAEAERLGESNSTSDVGKSFARQLTEPSVNSLTSEVTGSDNFGFRRTYLTQI